MGLRINKPRRVVRPYNALPGAQPVLRRLKVGSASPELDLPEGREMTETIPFWLALTRIEGLGIRGCHKLIQHFGSPQAAYMASLTELESCGVPARVAQAIFAQAAL